jgi:Tol biopolymer transport system component
VVQHCLEKNPAERFQSAHDIAFSLQALTGSDLQTMAVEAAPARRRWWKPLVAAAVLGVLGVAAFFGGRLTLKQTQPRYHQLTYRRGTVGNARFLPDGQNIVYTAAWDGGRKEMFTMRYDSVDSRSLDIKDSELLAVSSKGEMALRAKNGTLATVPFTGGTPREIERRVFSADWSPDGNDMAIIRRVGKAGEVGDIVLEYPRGKVLYHRDPRSGLAYLSHVRVSPDGKYLAFYSILTPGYARVIIIDTSGKKVAQSGIYAGPLGLGWGPSGREVWFAGVWQSKESVLGLELSGRTRVVLHVPTGLVVKDTSRQGRVLLARDDITVDTIGLPPGASKERSYSWYGWTGLSDLSGDGQYLVFAEGGTSGTDWGMYIRKTDGSPAVRLGTGAYGKLSPDGNWVAFAWDPKIRTDEDPEHAQDDQFLSVGVIRLLPVGAGEQRDLPLPKLAAVNVAGWLPNGTPIFLAEAPGRPPRTWAAPLDGTPVRPLTPEGVLATLPTPDGKYLLCNDPGRITALYPIAGGAPVKVQIPASAEEIGWDTSGKKLYIGERVVEDGAQTGWNISLLDPYTGRAQPWKQITFQSDRSGITRWHTPLISRDGKVYAYSYGRSMAQLYVVEGVQ